MHVSSVIALVLAFGCALTVLRLAWPVLTRATTPAEIWLTLGAAVVIIALLATQAMSADPPIPLLAIFLVMLNVRVVSKRTGGSGRRTYAIARNRWTDADAPPPDATFMEIISGRYAKRLREKNAFVHAEHVAQSDARVRAARERGVPLLTILREEAAGAGQQSE